jgi:hypothetical protein
MEILLIVALVAVGAAGLYVAVTFNARTRQNTAPLVADAVDQLSGQLKVATDDMRRQLRALADDLQQDREQQRLDGRKIQGRLDHADSRIASMANQLTRDLQQLNDRVARLGESRVPGESGPAVSAPEAVPGRLYVERLTFSVARVQTVTAVESRVRIEVERSVAELPSGPLGDLGDARAIMNRAENDQVFRNRLSEAAADFVVVRLSGPDATGVTERWITRDAFPEAAAAQACDRIASGLAAIVAEPPGRTATELRLPGPEALVLEPVTQPLRQAARFLEIVGVVVGVSTGFHPLALAAVKMLARDRVDDLLARGLSDAARTVFEPAAVRAEPATVTDLSLRTPGRPELTTEYPPRPRHPD